MERIDPKVIADVKARLKRVEGQARGLQKMLDEARSCEEILTQLSAMRSAIGSIATILMVENLEACLLDGRDDPSAQEAIARAKKLFAGFVR
ncbi:MAG: metal-sensitive transcriptional regulator [Clostridia bacterium]